MFLVIKAAGKLLENDFEQEIYNTEPEKWKSWSDFYNNDYLLQAYNQAYWLLNHRMLQIYKIYDEGNYYHKIGKKFGVAFVAGIIATVIAMIVLSILLSMAILNPSLFGIIGGSLMGTVCLLLPVSLFIDSFKKPYFELSKRLAANFAGHTACDPDSFNIRKFGIDLQQLSSKLKYEDQATDPRLTQFKWFKENSSFKQIIKEDCIDLESFKP